MYSEAEPKEGMMSQESTLKRTSTIGRDLHVMLVEDEPVELEIYRQKFASWDIPMQLTSAENGINALLKLNQVSPDLIITDLNMPIMDGFQMMRMLHQSIRSQNTLFVVVTGVPLDEVRLRDDFPPGVTLVSKPVDFASLEQIVRDRADGITC